MNDIKVILLGGEQGGFTVVSDEDFEALNLFKWCKDKDGYVIRTTRAENGDMIKMHRVVNGTPDGLGTDHKNTCRHDNTRRNLRNATPPENGGNRRKQNAPTTSRFKGVAWATADGCWQAHIRTHGRMRYLGSFDDEDEAARAYNLAAKEHFGEFALLNPVDEKLYDPASRREMKKAIYPGVYRHGKQWQAGVDGKHKIIGTFKHPETAADARDYYIKEHGLNKPLTFESIEDMDAVEETGALTPPTFQKV